jgi:drug/metabolite transporter (DMT)-like permease
MEDLLDPIYGEIAGIFTAICWAFTSSFFAMSGSIIGSVNVNRLRLAFAAGMLIITHYFYFNSFLPLDASPERWFWLGLSGLVGFVIGDAMLFEAFVIVGARISMLLMSLVPIMSALFAWLFLGEILTLFEIFVICVTVGGILWVVVDKNRDTNWVKGKRLLLGISLGIGGAMGQTFGLILSKKGLEGGYSTLSGNLIRVICAFILIWILALLRGKIKSTICSLKNKKALYTLSAGSFFGPFLGVWLSLVAIKYARIGIASTLISTTPIFLIPISYWLFKEKITMQTILGTVIAIAGVAILILSG